MDVESKRDKSVGAIPTDDHTRKRKRRRCICLTVIAVILAVAIVIVILAFTVFKAKRPVTTVNSLALQDIDISLDILRLRVLLNVSINADISVKNRNKVGFKYGNTSALLYYTGQVVGEVPIPAGKIGAEETLRLNVTLTVLANRLLANSHVYSDVISGKLPFTIRARIAGKVRIVFFNINVVSYTTCDVNVNVLNRSLGEQTCHYRTKI